MPMDWRVFGQRAGAGLQQTGTMISQVLLQDYARKLDEKYAKSIMDYQADIKEEQAESEFRRRKEEIGVMLKFDKNLKEWDANLQSEWKMFNNNPQWKAFAEKSSSPEATDQERANLAVIMSIRQRQALYLPLEKSHLDFLQSLHGISPGIAIDLYAQEHHNQAFLKELEVRKVQAKAMGQYRGSMADWYDQRPDIERDKLSNASDIKFTDKILEAHKRITEIQKSDDFQKGQNYMEEGLSEDTMKASPLQKKRIRIYKAGSKEIERLEKQIKIWEGRGGVSDKTEEEKTYTPADVQMIIEKDLIGAIVIGTKDGKPVKAIYRGNGNFEEIR